MILFVFPLRRSLLFALRSLRFIAAAFAFITFIVADACHAFAADYANSFTSPAAYYYASFDAVVD